jgi:hypothetical protein
MEHPEDGALPDKMILPNLCSVVIHSKANQGTKLTYYFHVLESNIYMFRFFIDQEL